MWYDKNSFAFPRLFEGLFPSFSSPEFSNQKKKEQSERNVATFTYTQGFAEIYKWNEHTYDSLSLSHQGQSANRNNRIQLICCSGVLFFRTK